MPDPYVGQAGRESRSHASLEVDVGDGDDGGIPLLVLGRVQPVSEHLALALDVHLTACRQVIVGLGALSSNSPDCHLQLSPGSTVRVTQRVFATPHCPAHAHGHATAAYLEQVETGRAEVRAHRLTVALHAARRVDRIAEQAVVRHLEPDHRTHHGPRVHAHADLKAQSRARHERACALSSPRPIRVPHAAPSTTSPHNRVQREWTARAVLVRWCSRAHPCTPSCRMDFVRPSFASTGGHRPLHLPTRRTRCVAHERAGDTWKVPELNPAHAQGE